MQSLNNLVGINRIGWFAIRHRDGWWIGNDEGVICYRDRDIAATAMTIAWQRDGGRELKYKIEVFKGQHKKVGEHTPKYSAEEAIKRYENQVGKTGK